MWSVPSRSCAPFFFQPWGCHPAEAGISCQFYGILSRVAYAYWVWEANTELELVPQDSVASLESYAAWLLAESDRAPKYSDGYVVLNLWELVIHFWFFARNRLSLSATG